MSDIILRPVEEEHPVQQAPSDVFSTPPPFIPPIKMLQGSSDSVKNGIYSAGTFIYNNQIDLGPEFIAILGATQPCALKFVKNELMGKTHDMQTEQVEDPFNPGETIKDVVGDELFKEVYRGQNDREKEISYRWGPELLVYVPEHKVWGNLFLGTVSARNCWHEFEPFLMRPCIIYSELIKKAHKGNRWHLPHCKPFEGEVENPPSQASYVEALKRFRPTVQKTAKEPAPDR